MGAVRILVNCWALDWSPPWRCHFTPGIPHGDIFLFVDRWGLLQVEGSVCIQPILMYLSLAREFAAVTDVSNWSRCLIPVLWHLEFFFPIPGAEQRYSINEIHFYFWLKPGCGEDTRVKATSMSTSKFVSCRLQSLFSPDLCCPQANRLLRLHLNCWKVFFYVSMLLT